MGTGEEHNWQTTSQRVSPEVCHIFWSIWNWIPSL